MRAIAIVATAASLTVACDSTGPERRLEVDGVVVRQDSVAPVSGAEVEIWFDGGIINPTAPERLAADSTDAAGRFHMSVGSPPGYSQPNCAVMFARVDAEGYAPYELSLTWAADDPLARCSDGGAVSVTLRVDPL